MDRSAQKVPHIGVCLAAPPSFGGSYQYNLAVAQALDPAATGWRTTAFCLDATWRGRLPARYEVTVPPRRRLRSALLTRLARRWSRHDWSFGLSLEVSRLLPLSRAIDQSSCDLVLFPAQDPESYRTAKPAIVTVHDLMHRYEPHFPEYGGTAHADRERHYRQIGKVARAILVDSELGKQQFIESYGRDAESVFVLPFCAPGYVLSSAAVDVRRKYGLFDQYLFYPAQFWEHKNHVRLIEALALVKARGIPVKLVLVGHANAARDRAVRRIEELSLQDDVKILGYVPNEDMRSLYQQAVGTVFVSLLGPTNIPPLEAMAVGSPLICSNAYAMPEQVGDAALLVDPKSAADMAEKIATLWTNTDLRAALAARGLARSASWTEAHFGARLRGVLQAVLQPATGAPAAGP